jgi:hypothetical protein
VKKMVTDIPRLKYEKLRATFFKAVQCERNSYWESFRLFGIYGLFENNHHRSYVVEVYQAPGLRWCGATYPSSLVLREALMQLISFEGSRNFIRSHL